MTTCSSLSTSKLSFQVRSCSKEWNQWISVIFLLTCKLSSSKTFLGSGLVRQSPDLEPSFISFNQDVYGTPGPSPKFLPERVLIRVTNSWKVADTACGDPVVLQPSHNGFYMQNVVYRNILTGADRDGKGVRLVHGTLFLALPALAWHGKPQAER